MSTLQIQGLSLPPIGDQPGGLRFYQESAIEKTLNSTSRFCFINHSPGLGKSVVACAIAQELWNKGEIDLVLFFTMKTMKVNIARAFNSFTSLPAKAVEGTKAVRRKKFAQNDALCFVLNYERCRNNIDFDILSELVGGKRVLFVLDEVQRVLNHTKGKGNKAAEGLKLLLQLAHKDSYIVPTSATVVDHNPERYYYLMDLMQGPNPLGSISAFRRKYARKIVTRSPWGMEVKYIYDADKLRDVPAIVEPYTHVARKSDPGIKEMFKETTFVPIFVQLSQQDRELYDIIIEAASEDDEDLWGQYYRILTYVCGTTAALKNSKSIIAQTICEELPDLSNKTSAKMDTLLDLIRDIQEDGDKCVVFSKYTNMGLFDIAEALTEAKVSHVVHYGTGQSEEESQAAQDVFKSDPSITVFLSSDAGSLGISLQEARYVISFDVPYSFDLLNQRNERINRADSYLDNLTAYVLIAEDTVEERIWDINQERGRLASAIQGTEESLGRDLPSEEENHKFLLFG